MNTLHIIICFLCFSLMVQRVSAQRDTVIVYKKIDTTELKVWIHYPEKVKKRHSSIIFFHGGGIVELRNNFHPNLNIWPARVW